MRHFSFALLALSAATLTACASVSDKSVSYDLKSGKTLVYGPHYTTSVTLQPVDLSSGKVTGDAVKMGGEFVPFINYSNERLTDYHINELGWIKTSPILVAGFEYKDVTPGTYAITESFTGGGTIAGTSYYTQGCFKDFAYVVEFKAGEAVYLDYIQRLPLVEVFGEAADEKTVPVTGYANYGKLHLKRLRFVLEEYPNMPQDVTFAPIVATVDFDTLDKNFLTTDGCDMGSTFKVIDRD